MRLFNIILECIIELVEIVELRIFLCYKNSEIIIIMSEIVVFKGLLKN